MLASGDHKMPFLGKIPIFICSGTRETDYNPLRRLFKPSNRNATKEGENEKAKQKQIKLKREEKKEKTKENPIIRAALHPRVNETDPHMSSPDEMRFPKAPLTGIL
jgi:hypothetical protein